MKGQNCFALFSSMHSFIQENMKANLTHAVNAILYLSNSVVRFKCSDERNFCSYTSLQDKRPSTLVNSTVIRFIALHVTFNL